jgi:hypothetical protein
VATGGAIGDIKDFYFDDEARALRYLMVDTSVWLPGHKKLILPLDHVARAIRVSHSSASNDYWMVLTFDIATD